MRYWTDVVGSACGRAGTLSVPLVSRRDAVWRCYAAAGIPMRPMRAPVSAARSSIVAASCRRAA